VATGLTPDDVEGKILIIYNFRGRATHCSVIGQSDTSTFEPYPGTTLSMPLTSGGVQIITDDGKQLVSAIFPTGISELCREDCDVPNCCGVHIHDGTSCDSAEDIGGHFWNKTLISEDPWLDIKYTTYGLGPATINDVEVETGLTEEEIDGKVFVVHDVAGVRIACAIIDVSTPPEPQPEPNVSGAIDKLEDAMDSIKHALSELGAAVNGSGKKGYEYYKPGYPGYPSDKDKYSCKSICADICEAEDLPQAPCEASCKLREADGILGVVGIFCERGVCPPSRAETNEEVGLLQSRQHRSVSGALTDDEDESDVVGCFTPEQYCRRFCKQGFELPPTSNTRIHECQDDCNANFAKYEVPLNMFKEHGCCDQLGSLYD